MSIQPSRYYSGTISVQTVDGKELYGKKFLTPDVPKNFIQKYGNSVEAWGDRALFIPLRTDTLENFAQDLFFPLLSSATKANDLAGRIFQMLAEIILDLALLPVRLITSPFRVIYNLVYPEKPHPLTELIKDKQALKSSQFNIKIHAERIEKMNNESHSAKLFPTKEMSSITDLDTLVTTKTLQEAEKKTEYRFTTETRLRGEKGCCAVERTSNGTRNEGPFDF